MVFGTILVDIISIILSSGKGGSFTTVFIPILEIIIKIGIVLFCAYDYFNNRKNRDSRYDSIEKRQSIQNQ